MKIQCEICRCALGEISGKLRNGERAAKFVCASCLADLKEARERRGEDMFNALFGGGFNR